MPWEIFSHDGRHCLRNKQTGKLVAGSCHDNRDDTLAMMRALYANVPAEKALGIENNNLPQQFIDNVLESVVIRRMTEGKAMTEEASMNDSLTYYGGAVKALGDGRIGGYVALFTTATDPDLDGDFFTKSTDFYLESGDKRPIIYNHGLNKTVKRQKFGRGTIKIDDTGVWMEGELNTRDKYGKRIYEMVEKGAMGYSTGSASHLVFRTQQGKSQHLDSWPIVEVSLTPTPIEPRTVAVPLKALVESVDLFDMETKSHEEETETLPEVRPLPLDAFPALRDCIVPGDLKGLDYRSEAVGAAVDELLTHWRMVTVAVKSYAAVLEDNARLRFERDGRPVSKKSREWTEAAIHRFDRLLVDHQEITNYLREIQKSFDRTDAQERFRGEKVRFELARAAALVGYEPTDKGDE